MSLHQKTNPKQFNALGVQVVTSDASNQAECRVEGMGTSLVGAGAFTEQHHN